VGPLIIDTREHNKNQRNQSWALNPGSHETEQSGQRAPTPVWTRCGLPCFLIFHRNPPVLWKQSQNWSSSVQQLTMVSYEEVSVRSTTTYKRDPTLHRVSQAFTEFSPFNLIRLLADTFKIYALNTLTPQIPHVGYFFRSFRSFIFLKIIFLALFFCILKRYMVAIVCTYGD